MPRFLYPGEPTCAPAYCVISEALICLLRKLHSSSVGWTTIVNRAIVEHLGLVGEAVRLMSVPQVTKTASAPELGVMTKDNSSDCDSDKSSGKYLDESYSNTTTPTIETAAELEQMTSRERSAVFMKVSQLAVRKLLRSPFNRKKFQCKCESKKGRGNVIVVTATGVGGVGCSGRSRPRTADGRSVCTSREWATRHDTGPA